MKSPTYNSVFYRRDVFKKMLSSQNQVLLAICEYLSVQKPDGYKNDGFLNDGFVKHRQIMPVELIRLFVGKYYTFWGFIPETGVFEVTLTQF